MICDCSVETEDSCQLCHTTQPMARKVYRCVECGDIIQPGQKYERMTILWEGIFERFNTCLVCAQIRNDYCPHGVEIGGLREQIADCMGFDYARPIDDEDEDE